MKKKFNILFYYPEHFLRNKNYNEYLQPLYEICKKNNISYLIIEEPDLALKRTIKSNNINFKNYLYFILILRKLLPIKLFKNFEDRENFIGKILKKFFPYEFDNIIVMSNSLVGIFRGMYPNSNIYDYQHGVITGTHPGYIYNNEPSLHIKWNKIKLFLYGNGFKQILLNNDKTNYYETNAISIGKKLKQNVFNFQKEKKNILFTLQIVDKNSFNNDLVDFYYEVIKNNYPFFEKNNITLYLRHHPRFYKDVDDSKLFKFPFVRNVSNEDLDNVLKDVFLHITLHSTTIFEAAEKFIPTLLIKNKFYSPEFYKKDFHYPLDFVEKNNLSEVIKKYMDSKFYKKKAIEVNNWFYIFYEQLNENNFLKSLKGF